MCPNTDQKNLRIWTLSTQYLLARCNHSKGIVKFQKTKYDEFRSSLVSEIVVLQL